MTQVGPMLAGPRWAPCQVGPMNIAIWVLKEVMWSKIIFQQNHCSLWQVDHALNDILEVWHRQLCIFILTHAIFSPNLHWWTNDACSCLLRTRTFCIIGIYKFMHQQLSLHYKMHIQHDCPSQMNSNLMVAITKLTHRSLSICCCEASNFLPFVRDNHAGSVFKILFDDFFHLSNMLDWWHVNIAKNVMSHLNILRCDMAFIVPMHCNKPNITYLSKYLLIHSDWMFVNGSMCQQ